MTVLDCIKRALRLLGALNVSDTPTAEESADALAALNALVDSWNSERLMLYTSARQVFAVTPGKQVYSLGATGADWTAARPLSLDSAGLLIAATPAPYERPLHVIRTDDEWARVRVKGVTSDLPTALYYEPDYPNATVTLLPAPSAASSVALYAPQAVSQFTSLAQTISLPPGYARALPYNLAIELAGEFDKEPPASVVAIAEESKATIKRANVPASMGRLRVDRALRSSGGGYFDYMTGEPR